MRSSTCPLAVLGMTLAVAAFAETPEQTPSAATPPADTSAPVGPGSALEQIAERLRFPGEAVEVMWLGQGSSKGLALFQPPGRTPVNGAIIILLPPNESIGDEGFTQSVRRALAAGGWAVLAVHGQLLDKSNIDAFSAEKSLADLHAGINYLNANGYTQIVVVASGRVAEGVWPAIQSGETTPIAFIAVGRWTYSEFAPPVPVFDIVNARDHTALDLSKERLASIHMSGTHAMERFTFVGVSNDYRHHGEVIGQRMRGWLHRQFVED